MSYIAVIDGPSRPLVNPVLRPRSNASLRFDSFILVFNLSVMFRKDVFSRRVTLDNPPIYKRYPPTVTQWDAIRSICDSSRIVVIGGGDTGLVSQLLLA